MVGMGCYEMRLGSYETCMGRYEMSQHKREIGEGEKGSKEIGFCLGNVWLIEGEFKPLE